MYNIINSQNAEYSVTLSDNIKFFIIDVTESFKLVACVCNKSNSEIYKQINSKTRNLLTDDDEKQFIVLYPAAMVDSTSQSIMPYNSYPATATSLNLSKYLINATDNRANHLNIILHYISKFINEPDLKTFSPTLPLWKYNFEKIDPLFECKLRSKMINEKEDDVVVQYQNNNVKFARYKIQKCRCKYIQCSVVIENTNFDFNFIDPNYNLSFYTTVDSENNTFSTQVTQTFEKMFYTYNVYTEEHVLNKNYNYYNYYNGSRYNLIKRTSFNILPDDIHSYLNECGDITGALRMYEKYFENYSLKNEKAHAGLIKVEKKFQHTLLKLKERQPHLFNFYEFVKSPSTIDKISNNKMIAQLLEKHGEDYDTFVSIMNDLFEHVILSTYSFEQKYIIRCANKFFRELETSQDVLQKNIEKQQFYKIHKLEDQLKVLNISTSTYPILEKCLLQDEFSTNLFHDPHSNQLINAEFDLLEKALSNPKWKDIICGICRNAAKRTTYEKEVTNYISFLFKIEQYLTKHTGKKWKAMPKFVSSSWELEMNNETNNDDSSTTTAATAATATVKTRSALTPIADNENCIITVPYVAMSLYGRNATYCYSLNYYVFEDLMIDPVSNTPIISGIEKKLNGRDDYGLMFYTLTGTNENTGYPTMLIIFEKLQHKKIKVHFHRVHPCRKLNGQTTPASQLIKSCYRYMAGNIEAHEIYKQQGDLIFIKSNKEQLDDDTIDVNEFESHAFTNVVKLELNKSKSEKNRLGFMYIPKGTTLNHPEHQPIVNFDEGIYECRRAKSYENNPVAQWSRTID